MLRCGTDVTVEQIRSQETLDLSCYHVWNYVSYLLYVPLYLAGPISTFKNFASQLQSPPKTSLFQVPENSKQNGMDGVIAAPAAGPQVARGMDASGAVDTFHLCQQHFQFPAVEETASTSLRRRGIRRRRFLDAHVHLAQGRQLLQ